MKLISVQEINENTSLSQVQTLLNWWTKATYWFQAICLSKWQILTSIILIYKSYSASKTPMQHQSESKDNNTSNNYAHKRREHN